MAGNDGQLQRKTKQWSSPSWQSINPSWTIRGGRIVAKDNCQNELESVRPNELSGYAAQTYHGYYNLFIPYEQRIDSAVSNFFPYSPRLELRFTIELSDTYSICYIQKYLILFWTILNLFVIQAVADNIIPLFSTSQFVICRVVENIKDYGRINLDETRAGQQETIYYAWAVDNVHSTPFIFHLICELMVSTYYRLSLVTIRGYELCDIAKFEKLILAFLRNRIYEPCTYNELM